MRLILERPELLACGAALGLIVTLMLAAGGESEGLHLACEAQALSGVFVAARKERAA